MKRITFQKAVVLLACFTGFSVNAFCQSSLQKGLVAYYPFNGSIKDESGLANHPVSSNISYTKGRTGADKTACYFNGKSSFIQVRHNESLTPSLMSLVAIVKPMGFYMGKCYNNSIIDKGSSDYLPGVYALRFTAGEYTKGDCDEPALAYQNFVGSSYVNPGATSKDLRVKLNNWYCLVYTISNTEEKLYVNGQLMSTVKKVVGTGKNEDDLFIGRKDNFQYPYWFNGAIDEIRIYNRVLSPDEVTSLCSLAGQTSTCQGQDIVAGNFSYTISDCKTISLSLSEKKNSNLKSVAWSFGDGSTSAVVSPVHTFKNSGTYKVRAIVTGKSGCKDTVVQQIRVNALKTDFTYTETAQPGELIFSVQKNLASYKWNLGDEQPVASKSVITHRYSAPGKYRITLFAADNAGCKDTITKEIAISFAEKNITGSDTSLIKPAARTATPVTLQKRVKELAGNIEVSGDSITISLYDNGIIDGDSITLVYNNETIVNNHLLKEKPLTLRLAVDRIRASNELVMYAENLGSIPPNTALLIVYDGEKRYEIPISSSLQSNGVVTFSVRR